MKSKFLTPSQVKLVPTKRIISGRGKLAIIIPQIHGTLSESAQLSYDLLLKNSQEYPKFILYPEGLKLDFDTSNFTLINLDPSNFASINSYNSMLLSKWFYKLFINYKYILIYQNDALLLKNNIHEWLSKKKSYFGAPYFRKNGKLKSVGNGGFSLRNVKDHLSVLESNNIHLSKLTLPILRQYFKWTYFKYWIKYFISRDKDKKENTFIVNFNRAEDEFWIYFAPLFSKKYILPKPHDAIGFAAESMPDIIFKMNNGLPLGAHAWEKHNKEFWIKHIQQLEKD